MLQDGHNSRSYTLNMLKTPVRDGLGFAKNAHAKTQAQLSAEEEVGRSSLRHRRYEKDMKKIEKDTMLWEATGVWSAQLG